MAKSSRLTETERLMGALVRMKPKAHEDMKLGKPRGNAGGSPAQSAKTKDGKSGVSADKRKIRKDK